MSSATYRNDPKFSNRQVQQTEQTQIRLLLEEQPDLWHSVYNFWTYFSMVKLNCSNLRIITAIFLEELFPYKMKNSQYIIGWI